MFIAHLPAGYLLTDMLRRRGPRSRASAPALMAAGLAGAVAPDIDLLVFFLLDGRVHHHAFPSHWPLAWLVLLGLSAGRDGRAAERLRMFSVNGLLHLVLDSVAGDIRWAAPWSARGWSLVAVPALHQPWWLNFLLHWTFALELLLVVAAVWRIRRSWGRGSGGRAR